MTVWVLSIDKDHPQHWEYAKRDKVWDLRTRKEIEAGDTVYFWQSRKSLVRETPTVGAEGSRQTTAAR